MGFNKPLRSYSGAPRLRPNHRAGPGCASEPSLIYEDDTDEVIGHRVAIASQSPSSRIPQLRHIMPFHGPFDPQNPQ